MKYCLIIALSFLPIAANCQQIVSDDYIGYNNDGLVNSQKSKTSNGDELTHRTVFVNDVTIPPSCVNGSFTLEGVKGYHLIQSRHMLNATAETYTILKKNGTNTEKVTEAALVLYWDDKPYPKYKYAIETEIPLSGFSPVTIATNGCDVVSSPLYKLQESYDAYDRYGNLLQTTKTGGKKYSVIYGYKGAYSTAIVNNAGIDQIAFTSFERMDDNGYWNLPPMGTPPLISIAAFSGQQSFLLGSGNNITRSGLIPGQYIVSYWFQPTGSGPGNSITVSGTTSVKTGNTVRGWTYMEHTITISSGVDISGTGFLDDLRLYPVSGQMETYTYKPMVGVTSKCDVKGMLVSYEYDQLGRIVLVKDQHGKIIKKNEYGLQSAE